MAVETSNPLPTLPCASECTYCARLCSSSTVSASGFGRRPCCGSLDAPAPRLEVQCRTRADTSDVTMAADEPRPVLCTSRIVHPSGANGMGVSCGRARTVSARPLISLEVGRCERGTHGARLRVEVVRADDGDLERAERGRRVERARDLERRAHRQVHERVRGGPAGERGAGSARSSGRTRREGASPRVRLVAAHERVGESGRRTLGSCPRRQSTRRPRCAPRTSTARRQTAGSRPRSRTGPLPPLRPARPAAPEPR